MSGGCSGCGRRWTSLTQAHCQLCHQHFGSHGLADKHHTYDERRVPTCHDATTLTSRNGLPVFTLSALESEGPVWRSYATDDRWNR